MSLEVRPPAELLGIRRQAVLSPAALVWVLVALAVISGWQVLYLPGHLVRRHVAPADQPWYPYGLRTAFLRPDGELVVKRKGYLDRIGTYIYKSSGRLEKVADDNETYMEHDDVAGIFRGNRKRMTESQMALDVNCSTQYFRWIAAVKNNAGDPQRVAEIIAGDGGEFMDGPSELPEPHVKVSLYPDAEQVYPLLEGHQYYPVFDGAAFYEPHLWLTTDRGTWLHQLWIRDLPDYGVTVLKSVQLGDAAPQASNTILGYDPQRGELFMLTADGRRRWFEPDTLKLLDTDQLAGEWRLEYAALAGRGEEYSFHYGLALSEPAYLRLMRVLMVVFLGSLLWLLFIWSRRWMSILGQTTADTTPSSN